MKAVSRLTAKSRNISHVRVKEGLMLPGKSFCLAATMQPSLCFTNLINTLLERRLFTVHSCQKSKFAVIYTPIQELAHMSTLFLTLTDTSLLV